MTWAEEHPEYYVKFWGDPNSRIALIGEAPWVEEVVAKKPFAGKSGALLEEWWNQVGLRRSDFWIYNAYPFRGPTSHIDEWHLNLKEELIPWYKHLKELIAQLPAVNVVVTAGNYALYALMQLGKVKWINEKHRPGILQLRGSIFQYEGIDGRKLKLIPVIHPAAVFNNRALY